MSVRKSGAGDLPVVQYDKLAGALIAAGLARLIPPRLVKSPIPLPRLDQAFDLAKTRPLTIVSAAPGSGKTTFLALLRQRLIARHQKVAWLSFEQDDRPQSIVGYCLDALSFLLDQDGKSDRASPGAALDLVRQDVQTVMARIAALEDTVTLLIDDLPAVNTDPETAETLRRLIQNLPPNMHLVVASRGPVALPIARLRAADQVVEIGGDQFRFGQAEAQQLVEMVSGVSLSAQDGASLAAATDGWAAGLQFAGIALRSGRCARNVSSTLAAARNGIWDYFDQCLTPDLATGTIDLAMQCAVLDRIGRDLCIAVCDDPSAGAMLEALRAHDLFISQVDHDGWFRLHPLFREFLIDRLARSEIDAAGLHRRAALWFADRGMWRDAIRHRRAAGDREESLDWIEAVAMREIEHSHVQEVLDWVNDIDDATLARRPWLALAAAWAYNLTIKVDRADHILALIDDNRAALPRSEAAVMIDKLRALRLSNFAMANDPESLLGYATTCREERDRNVFVSGDPWVEQIIRHSHIDALLNLGRPQEARLDQPIYDVAHLTDKSLFATSYGQCISAMCEIRMGLLSDAEDRLRAYRDIALRHGGSANSAQALIASVLGAALYERNQLDEVEALLEGQLELIGDTCFLNSVLLSHLSVARTKAARDDLTGSYAVLARARQLAEARNWTWMVAAVAAERIRMQIGKHDLSGATRSFASLQRRLGDMAGGTNAAAQNIRLLIELSALRLDLAKAFWRDAAARLDRLDALARSTANPEIRLEVLLARGQIALAEGDHDTARIRFTAALRLGEESGYVRTIRDRPKALLDALASVRAGGGFARISSDYLDTLLSGADAGAPRSAPAPSPVAEVDATLSNPDEAAGLLTEGLSQRELDVVRYLNLGRSNKEIARDLGVTPETVKWHLKNVFSKMSVTSRGQAVFRAKALGLLD